MLTFLLGLIAGGAGRWLCGVIDDWLDRPDTEALHALRRLYEVRDR